MKGISMQDNRYVQQSNVDRNLKLESESEVSEPKHVKSDKSTIGHLFVLDASSGEIFSMKSDGSVLITPQEIKMTMFPALGPAWIRLHPNSLDTIPKAEFPLKISSIFLVFSSILWCSS